MAKFNLITAIVSFFAVANYAAAFTTLSRTSKTTFSKLMMVQQGPPPVQQAQIPATMSSFSTSSSILNNGINEWTLDESSAASSSFSVSLKERHVPTKEEVEAKKRNFNLLFWGGGFVAPFLSTVFYFGFKFWEK